MEPLFAIGDRVLIFGDDERGQIPATVIGWAECPTSTYHVRFDWPVLGKATGLVAERDLGLFTGVRP